MAGWDHNRPPRTSSRWQPPGIFLNVEFGVSLGPDHRTHTTGLKYTSRRMEEKLHEDRIRRQHEGGHYYQLQEQPGELQQLATLGALMPGPDEPREPAEWIEAERRSRHQQQERQRRLGVRTREQHERGRSAPPSLIERNQPVSPTVNYVPHIAPIQHTQSMPSNRIDSHDLLPDRTNQPLPPTPSQFRLGEDNLPWSVPAWYRSPEQSFASPSVAGVDQETYRTYYRSPEQSFASPSVAGESYRTYYRSPEHPAFASPSLAAANQDATYRTEDPLRVRELEALQQAMMTVDSLGHDGWEPWTWDSVEEMPRGPRSIGWAVSSREGNPRLPPVQTPPPYAVSQWEQSYSRDYAQRPRSAYS